MTTAEPELRRLTVRWKIMAFCEKRKKLMLNEIPHVGKVVNMSQYCSAFIFADNTQDIYNNNNYRYQRGILTSSTISLFLVTLITVNVFFHKYKETYNLHPSARTRITLKIVSEL